MRDFKREDVQCLDQLLEEGSERSAANGVVAPEPPADHTAKILRRIVTFARTRHGITEDPWQFAPPPADLRECAKSTTMCSAWLHECREARDKLEPTLRLRRERYFASHSDDGYLCHDNNSGSDSPHQLSGTSEAAVPGTVATMRGIAAEGM
jgi:hypothetical protein